MAGAIRPVLQGATPLVRPAVTSIVTERSPWTPGLVPDDSSEQIGFRGGPAVFLNLRSNSKFGWRNVEVLRTGVEGARRFALGAGDGATLTPSFELGLRLDGDDAETGFGADLGGGLAFADPKHGLLQEFRARGLLAHESPGFREWCASAGLAWDPRPDTDRGLSLSLRQGWGASPTGGMDALLGRETLAGLAANDNPGSGAGASGNGFEAASRLEAGIGYGIVMFGGGFTGTPHAGLALTDTGRQYRLGRRLTSAVRGEPGFEVGLEATRGENDNAPAEHGLMLRGTIRW